MPTSEPTAPSPLWTRVEIASKMVAAVLLPLVLALLGQGYTRALREREIGVQYVELAVAVLRESPRPETSNLRDWAIDVINYHALVPLPRDVQQELRREQLQLELVSNMLKAIHDSAMVPVRNLR